VTLYSTGAAESPRTEGGGARPRENPSDTVDDMSDTAVQGDGTSRALVGTSGTKVVMQEVEERTGGWDATSSWSLQYEAELQQLEDWQRTGTVAEKLKAMELKILLKNQMHTNLIESQKLRVMHDFINVGRAAISIAQSIAQSICAHLWFKVEKANEKAVEKEVEKAEEMMRKCLADELRAVLLVRARACPRACLFVHTREL
jgi:hypothetical protein